ncbi:mannose-6-phosphate isomerase, class I [Salinicoccus albus]|uniref:mannose-6-phosphate isomerase, class I n=1 Tax=Salinicoccus albus TaxID=418756 RepID=UPI0003702BE1|nr:mannose-6-phosphate isomerase, class I [Salinicoccus albus]
MKSEPIFLEPVMQERIWGGVKLREKFGYDIPSETTGEAWVISAHQNGPSRVINGQYEGKTLDELWAAHGELFNKKEAGAEYPLLVKILDAADDLSVQVHPDDAYAARMENVPYGKTECWYVLEAAEGANIILGHTASDKETFDQMIDRNAWEQLFSYVDVTEGDFIYVPSGTIHAIGRGITILEVQQSSDVTYRVYDYDRTDSQGQKRALHLDKVREAVNIPHAAPQLDFSETGDAEHRQTRLVEAEYFTVEKWEVAGASEFEWEADFLQVNVIEGKGRMKAGDKEYKLMKGMNFILPHGIDSVNIDGEIELIVSHP